MGRLIELCVGVDDVAQPLPPPRVYAIELRAAALRFVHTANQKYGGIYKQIGLAHRFLQRAHSIDFTRAIDAVHASRAEEQAEAARRAAAVRRETVVRDEVKAAMADAKYELNSILTQLEAALPLAVPDIEAEPDRIADSAVDTSHFAIDALRALGSCAGDVVANSASGSSAAAAATGSEDDGEGDDLVIAIAHRHSTTYAGRVLSVSNTSVLDTIAECSKVLRNRFAGQIARWIHQMQGNHAPGVDELLAELLVLKGRVSQALGKCDQLIGGSAGAPTTDHPAGIGSGAISDFDPGNRDDSYTESDGDFDSDLDENELEEVQQLVLPNGLATGSDAGAAHQGGDLSDANQLADLGLAPAPDVTGSAHSKRKGRKKRTTESNLVDINGPKPRQKLRRLLRRPSAVLKGTPKHLMTPALHGTRPGRLG